ncbi:hypothetical protein Cme02nite_24390 [Catellatospora methionotrophica]|uniref:Diguanylate cyclase/phosphodiesterase n=2 Tax=Catellatospora methionotrophica TaxID=121620 RepID=A0A8J3L899_9ACTN|nr:hypothetical protein Cme02nite_24390 [Catellatospora methionotrophica]
MQVVALTGLVTLTSLAQVHVRIRSNLQSVHWADAALLVAAVLLPVHWAIICATAGTFIVKVIQRPQPGPLKFAFAVAKQTITCAIAALIVNINGSVATEPLAHLQLLAIAFAAAFLADELLVTPVIALASRTRARDRFLAHLDLRVIAAVVRFAVAVLALAVLSQEPQLLIAIPAIVLSLQLTYRGKLRARAERLAWQQLAEATDAMNVVQMETVLHTAVHNGARLFSADRVEIEVSLDGAQQLVRGSQGEITYHAAPDQGTVDPDTTAVVALVGDNDGERVGELRLCFQAPVALSEREQFTLRAFAGALCTAIRNATSYAQLEHLAGQHQHDATHDLLTGLPNRRRLQLDTEDALDRRRGGRGVTALLVLDLNHFKDVNDALGHAAGDQVLIAVAQRLSAAAGPEALVTRLGGDEFAVLLRQLPAPALALYQAEHLLSTLHEPVDVDGMPLVVSASAGVATAPSEGGFVELLRRADIAMYQAKRTGCSVASYAPDNDTADRARLVVGGMIALDDFGTGYSSLSVLSRVPAKELKIDRSFVMQMENTPSAAAVVRSHLELGRHLDLLVVAEGVERESQRRMLWDLGCTAGQGHLFAKPMPLDEVLALVSADDGPVRLADPLHDPTAVVRMPAKRNPGRISRTTGTGGGERVSDSTA